MRLSEYIKTLPNGVADLFNHTTYTDYPEPFDTATVALTIARQAVRDFGGLSLRSDVEEMTTAELQSAVHDQLFLDQWRLGAYGKALDAMAIDGEDPREVIKKKYAQDITGVVYGQKQDTNQYGATSKTDEYGATSATDSFGATSTTMNIGARSTTDSLGATHSATQQTGTSYASTTGKNTTGSTTDTNAVQNGTSSTAATDSQSTQAHSDTHSTTLHSDTHTSTVHTDTLTKGGHTDTTTRNAREDTEERYSNLDLADASDFAAKWLQLANVPVFKAIERLLVDAICTPYYE